MLPVLQIQPPPQKTPQTTFFRHTQEYTDEDSYSKLTGRSQVSISSAELGKPSFCGLCVILGSHDGHIVRLDVWDLSRDSGLFAALADSTKPANDHNGRLSQSLCSRWTGAHAGWIGRYDAKHLQRIQWPGVVLLFWVCVSALVRGETAAERWAWHWCVCQDWKNKDLEGAGCPKAMISNHFYNEW